MKECNDLQIRHVGSENGWVPNTLWFLTKNFNENIKGWFQNCLTPNIIF